jgi:hypothetical protein
MPDTATDIQFGDGTYRAWLPLPQAVELERKCGVQDREGKLHPKSLFTIYEEIGAGFGADGDGALVFLGGASVPAKDCNEVIRLGLIGGNSGPDGDVGPVRAGQLVDLYGYPGRPLSEVAATAWKILHAAIVGIDVKKKDGPAPAEMKASEKAS